MPDRRRLEPSTAPVERRRPRPTTDRYREAVRDRLAEVARAYALSPREREVFELLLQGWSADEIARRIGVTPRTVRFHQRNVLDKLEAESRLHLVRLVFWG